METIWSFGTNESVETDKIDLKPFKPTGRFFEDVQTLTKIFNIRVHPALKESAYKSENDEDPKDIITLSFMKHRLDRNTLRTMFLCLPPA
jgi:hypothetical protein